MPLTNNNHNYPHVYFPEVYILEGGYCQYFKESSVRRELSGYVEWMIPTMLSLAEKTRTISAKLRLDEPSHMLMYIIPTDSGEIHASPQQAVVLPSSLAHQAPPVCLSPL